jgi:hypothetical protein
MPSLFRICTATETAAERNAPPRAGQYAGQYAPGLSIAPYAGEQEDPVREAMPSDGHRRRCILCNNFSGDR